MPEKFAIYWVLAGMLFFFMATAGLLISVLIKLRRENASAVEHFNAAMQDMHGRLGAIEQQAQDQVAETSDLRLEIGRQNRPPGAPSSEVIAAASSGMAVEQIVARFGLREAEARLLSSVYGMQSAKDLLKPDQL